MKFMLILSIYICFLILPLFMILDLSLNNEKSFFSRLPQLVNFDKCQIVSNEIEYKVVKHQTW